MMTPRLPHHLNDSLLCDRDFFFLGGVHSIGTSSITTGTNLWIAAVVLIVVGVAIAIILKIGDG